MQKVEIWLLHSLLLLKLEGANPETFLHCSKTVELKKVSFSQGTKQQKFGQTKRWSILAPAYFFVLLCEIPLIWFAIYLTLERISGK